MGLNGRVQRLELELARQGPGCSGCGRLHYVEWRMTMARGEITEPCRCVCCRAHIEALEEFGRGEER